MPNLKLYLDTSVINFLHAEDSPDFQRVTKEFFDHQALRYDLYISDIVHLANLYVESAIVPPNKMEDALHVAYATVYEMDILLSWNFKHLANVNKEAKIQIVNFSEGYRRPLRLTSPMEVLDDRED